MSKDQLINELLQKFIANTISQSEFEELFSHIGVLDLEDDIKALMNQRWEDINASTANNFDQLSQNDELLGSIIEKIGENKPKRKFKVVNIYSVVAVFFLVFCSGYFYYINSNRIENERDASDSIISEVVTLKLNNGEVKMISEQDNKNIINATGLVVGKQTGNVLAYKNNVSAEKLAYNTLTVPYGKRFQVILSDGTKVHLNAGTSLKYPIKFIYGLNREVFLDGEAFFEVAKDAEHPFLVNSKGVNVKVLGTKFNITSYPEDDIINTVLIEGSVEVYEKNQNLNSKPSTILKPGYGAIWNKLHKNITVEKVNIDQFTAWMHGRLILDEVSFANIQKKLERQYNVTFINNNKALNKRRFTARFDIENIDQVMKSLSISASFDYTINSNNQIIIN